MTFGPFDPQQRFRQAWEAVRIARTVSYSLFTFGHSELPYFLVVDAAERRDLVSITQGEVRVTRPMIITPDNARPEFRGFFDNPEYEGLVDLLLARTAAFSHLQFNNMQGAEQIVSDSSEEAISRLNGRLDEEDEDRVAILAAPHGLGGIAVMRYAAERIWQSAPENIQELRERGFLPDV